MASKNIQTYCFICRVATGSVTLSTLEQASTPLDTALQNQRPTVVEFYANWCEVCRELTPDIYKVSMLCLGNAGCC